MKSIQKTRRKSPQNRSCCFVQHLLQTVNKNVITCNVNYTDHTICTTEKIIKEARMTTTTYWAAHVNNGVTGTQHTCWLCWKCKCTGNVRAELDGNPDSHDEIDQWQSIERYRPDEHEAEHARNDHRDRPNNDGWRPNVEAKKKYCDDEDCC